MKREKTACEGGWRVRDQYANGLNGWMFNVSMPIEILHEEMGRNLNERVMEKGASSETSYE